MTTNSRQIRAIGVLAVLVACGGELPEGDSFEARDLTTTFTQWTINADEYKKGINSTIANGNDPIPTNSHNR